MKVPSTKLSYRIHELTDYINWLYFFHSWGFQPRFATIADYHDCDACQASWLSSFAATDKTKAAEALKLYKEATKMLHLLDADYHVYALYCLADANSEGDDLLLNQYRLPLLRQQSVSKESDAFLCLSDFVRPASHHIADTVGIFATTVDIEMEQLYANDSYKQMLVKTLCERLAEAATEKMHQYIRKEVWGYAQNEQLTKRQLLDEEYQGIRPAVGYPSLPDISINFLLDEIIGFGQIGITLTENGMMIPRASVSGLMFSHPASRYFSIGKIDEEQLQDYAERKHTSVEEVRKYLVSNL